MPTYFWSTIFLPEFTPLKTGVFFQPISRTKVNVGAVRSFIGLEYRARWETGVVHLRTLSK